MHNLAPWVTRLGAEVWVKRVDADTPAPTDPAALTFLTMTSRASFRAEFKAGGGGKTAVYMARWVNTRGENGPWSEFTAATQGGKITNDHGSYGHTCPLDGSYL